MYANLPVRVLDRCLARGLLATSVALVLASAGPALADTGDTGPRPWIHGMEDGCDEGETVTLTVDPPGDPVCDWAFDEGIDPGADVDRAGVTSIDVTCPDCVGEDETEAHTAYVICIDEWDNARWDFADIVVTCGEDVEAHEVGGCGCGGQGRTVGWIGLGGVGVLVWTRTRRRSAGPGGPEPCTSPGGDPSGGGVVQARRPRTVHIPGG